MPTQALERRCKEDIREALIAQVSEGTATCGRCEQPIREDDKVTCYGNELYHGDEKEGCFHYHWASCVE